MEDRVLALCELSGDLLYHKIPQDRLAYYVDGALSMGREAALDYKGADLPALYKEKGIRILYKDGGKGQFGIVYRGQSAYGRDGSEVELVRESIQALSDHSAPPGQSPALTYEKALDVHLAHEFFHYLEYETGTPVSGRLDPVVTMQLFGLKRRARINKCSEVAAHAFAQAVTGLPVLPNYYDYLYLIHTGKMTRERFAAMVEENAALLAGGASPGG